MSEIEKTEKRAAGVTKKAKAEVKGKIVEFAWWLKKNGYREPSIEMWGAKLKKLLRLGADLLDPESVKEIIAKQSWTESTKRTFVNAYHNFAKFAGISWNKPLYKGEETMPFIPSEKEIDQLIAACGKVTATFLQLLKETGMRAGEAGKLKWTDIDFERRKVYVKPEKGSNPRILPISNKLASMISRLPKKYEHVFSSAHNIRTTFHYSRKLAAQKLGNPRLLQIHFHTFRHWKATMEYHKTKDILHVKQLLGHKTIKNTEIYITIENALFTEENAEYTTRVATSVKGARALLEAGFEYVTDMNNLKIFRKRK